MIEEVEVAVESPQNNKFEEEVRECSGGTGKRPLTRARKSVNVH